MLFNGTIDDYQRPAMQSQFPNILEPEAPKVEAKVKESTERKQKIRYYQS